MKNKQKEEQTKVAEEEYFFPEEQKIIKATSREEAKEKLNKRKGK